MKVTLDYALKLNPKLNPDLFIPDPKLVLKKMDKTPIRDWLNFISTEYRMSKVKNLILIPCSFYKPYDPPHDEFYRRINEIKKKVVDTKFITVSVPLALEPEKFWSFQWNGHNLIYDCPFFPWIEKFGYRWDEEVGRRVFSELRLVIDHFFERNHDNFEKVNAFFVRDSDELRLVEEYADLIVPEEEHTVEISYDNNTSEVYCHPRVWSEFETFLRNNGILE